MNILITGARAPICSDLVRCFAAAGHTVQVCDSLLLPIGRFSPEVTKYHRLPAPAKEFEKFSTALRALVLDERIDRIIPTSEEVFWLAQIPEIATHLCAPTAHQLNTLHHKGLFASVARRLGYGAPIAVELHSLADAEAFLQHNNPADFVLKPCYSRFGVDVLLSPSASEVLSLPFNQEWLAQTRIHGKEVCIYSVADNGKLCLLVAYEPVYRAGPGASIYFRPISDPRLTRFATDVIATLNLTGQISFDVMLTETEVVALECNPRGVSGIHLAAQQPLKLAQAMLTGAAVELSKLEPRMLALAFLMYQPLAVLSVSGRHAFAVAKDALCSARVPWYGSFLATGEILVRALVNGKSPLVESTRDIEWNGK